MATTDGLEFVLHGLVALARSGDNSFTSRTLDCLHVLPFSHRLQNYGISSAAGMTLFAAAPGLLLQASLATSEVIATRVLLLPGLFWPVQIVKLFALSNPWMARRQLLIALG